ncbi:MAG: glycosyltransferase [uncultured bacterium]|nr:MAG: glycosyltransferase [uncultured bacterium]
MNIFIVIPFRNEKKHIVDVVKGLSKYKLPIVLVDDGSTDKSGLKIEGLRLKNLTLLTHKVNLGKGAAMKTGAEYAFANGAGAIIFMDGDNQHDPSDLPKFTKELEKGNVEAVFGARNFAGGVPLIRLLGNKFASFIIRVLFGIKVSDVLCGFKALTGKAYKKIKWESTGYGVETEMIARAGKTKLKFSEVTVRAIYHDKVKGVTILDAIGIMGEIVKWWFTI